MVGNTRKRYKQIRKTPFTKKANFWGQDEEFGRPEVMYDDDLLYPQFLVTYRREFLQEMAGASGFSPPK